MKNETKIREWLGNDYHLTITIGVGEPKWKLFEKYEGWMHDGSGAIMTSETNTDEELYEFARKHRKYNISHSIGIANIIITFIAMVFIFIGIFINNDRLKAACLGMDLAVIIISLVKMNCIEHNHKIDILKFYERIERTYKGIKNEREDSNRESS